MIDLSGAPKFALDIVERINQASSDRRAAMFVGGCVRDTIVGNTVNDWDIATTMVPADVINLFENEGLTVVPTGIDHGTVTIVDPDAGDLFEVTTLRKDVSTDGRRATIEFTTSWKEDAQRRDLTFNALFCDQFGVVHDFVGGVDDLDNRVVRFVGDPWARINEDFLRVIRLVRFAARLDCEIPESVTKIFGDPMVVAKIVENVSKERIWDELKKIAKGPNVKWAIETLKMIGTNRQTGVFPGLLFALGISAEVNDLINTTRFARQDLTASSEDIVFPSLVLWINGVDPLLNENFPISINEARQFKLWKSFFTAANTDRGIDVQWVKDLLFDNRHNEHFRRVWLTAVVNSLRDENAGLKVFVNRWNVPKLPVNGDDALDLGFRGLHVGKWLFQAARMFRDSDFTATREDLLDGLL